MKKSREILKNPKIKEMEIWPTMWYRKSSSKREVHSNAGLPPETRRISNKQLYNFHIKKLEKEETIKIQVSRWKEIKIRTKINEIETKR